MPYLDENGLLYLWGKIKEHVTSAIANKVDKVAGKGLSTNDYTTAEKNKLAGLDEGANKYVHPAYTAKTAGLYKVTVDAAGHVSATTAVAKEDITELGIPAQDTTYNIASPNSNGLMSFQDKGKLDGINLSLYLTETESKELFATQDPFEGCTASTNGAAGLVPAPSSEDVNFYLNAQGYWSEPVLDSYVKIFDSNNTLVPVSTVDFDTHTPLNFVYSSPLLVGVTTDGMIKFSMYAATSSANGYMSSADKAKLDAFGEASTYAKKTDITGMYKYKGSVASASALPTTGQAVGDVYNIETSSSYGGAGMNVAWDGSKWDPLGEVFSITSITNAEIDTICV